MEVFSEAMNSVCQVYEAKFRKFEGLYEASAGEVLAVSVNALLCDALYNVAGQSELENRSHEVFGAHDRENFGDLAKALIKYGSSDHVACSALQFFS